MKARSTEISVWHGNLQGGFTAAVPGWVSAWVNVQGDRCPGNRQMLRSRAGVLGQVCWWSWAALRCPWSTSDFLQLCLWHFSLRMMVQSYTFPRKVPPLLLAAQFWSTDPILLDLLHPLQLVLAQLWLLEPNFPLVGCIHPLLGFSVLPATVPRCFWLPQLLLQQGCS